MLVSNKIAALARAHGLDNMHLQRGKAGEQPTRAAAVVELLNAFTSPAAQPGARRLLQQMAAVSWEVLRGVHSSPSDGTPHVLIRVEGERYHLRLDRRGCVFDITAATVAATGQRERPSGAPPWVAPGGS